jgi:peptidoglycan/xylan/chitin deacetylase (PgdA/CDA1 family)
MKFASLPNRTNSRGLTRHRYSRPFSLAMGNSRWKSWAKKALVKSAILRTAARLKPPAAVILAYHSVRDEPERDSNWIAPGITHATKVFTRHMELVARKFHPVTLEDILLFVKGEKILPPRSVAVTIDDGYLDNIEVAAPVLSRFGISAAFYLTVGMIGQLDAPWFCRVRHAFMATSCTRWDNSSHNSSSHNSSLHNRIWDLSSPPARDAALLAAYDICAPLVSQTQEDAVRTVERELQVERTIPEHRLMMNWDEAKALRRAGHVVGSHTLTHPNVAHVAHCEVQHAELVESKSRMEKKLGEPVVHFSYPHPALNPQWNEHTLKITREAGYSTALTTTKAPVVIGTNPLLLTRLNAPRPEHEFLWNLERAFLKRPRDPFESSLQMRE